MEISELLTTKPEDCSKEDLETAIHTLNSRLRDSSEKTHHWLANESYGKANEYLQILKVDAWMLDNLLQKFSHK